jgi:hypothetical protein
MAYSLYLKFMFESSPAILPEMFCVRGSHGFIVSPPGARQEI